MSKSAGRCVALSFLLSLSSSALGGELLETIPRITVLVYNYARVPRPELAQAKQEVTRILRQTGVATDWRDYPLESPGGEPTRAVRQGWVPTTLALRIFPRSMAERYGFSSRQCGFALPAPEGHFGNVASVFYHCVEELAEHRFRGGKETLGQILSHRMTARAMILGHLMAHEMGHLLLGQNSHSAKGIMHVPWSRFSLARAASGKLLFTPKEANRIRAQVQERGQAAQSARVSQSPPPTRKANAHFRGSLLESRR